MKKAIAILFAVVFAFSALAACGRADGSGTATPSSAVETVKKERLPQEAIDAASTAEELRALIAAYRTAGDNDNAYLAAKKLLTLDPADTQAYQDAIAALLGGISGDYTEIQNLVTLCLQNAPDGASAFAHWASGQKQDFSFTVPFVADYASEAEINTVGISAGNLSNTEVLKGELWQNGLMTTQGNWVYFMIPNEDYYVYKMKLDGTGLTNVGDARGDNLNVVGDWLYYRNLNDQAMIYRIRTDGTQKEGPIFNKAGMMSVTKDWIYYCDGGLYKIRTDGSETVTLLNDSCAQMAMEDGWVYYCTGGNRSEFYRVSTEGGEPQKLLDGWMYHFLFDDGWLYYMINTSDAVCRMRPDGSEQSEVYRNDYPINSFSIADGKLAASVCMEKDDRGKPYPTDLIVTDLASGETLFTQKMYVPNFYTAGETAYYFDENSDWHSLNLTTGENTVIQASAAPAAAAAAEATQEPQGPSVVGNSAANLFMQMDESTVGILARQDDLLCFANPRDDMQFYTASQNGNADLKKLLDTSVTYLNVVDGTIYYCDKWKNQSICTIGTDGQNQVNYIPGECADLSYADGWLYYRTKNGVFKLPAEGGEPTELVPGQLRCVYAYAGWVYFMEDNQGGGLWRIPVDGGERQPLLTDHHTLFYAIQDDLLYCLIDGGDSVDVIRMKLDGSEQKEVFSLNEKIHAINVSNRRLIIVKDSDSGSNFMALVLDPDKFTVENKIDRLLFPCVFCFGSDAYYVSDEGFVRQNLDTAERVVIVQ